MPEPHDRVGGAPLGRRSLPLALLILAVFWIASRMQELAVRVPGYRELYERHPFYVPSPSTPP